MTYSGGRLWAGRWRAKRRTLCLVICLFQAGDLCQPLRCEREGRLHEILTEERIGRRACKNSSRSSYPCNRSLCCTHFPADPCNSFEKLWCPLVPRALGGGVAGGCEREGRLCQILTKERIGRRDWKISSRSNYPYGRRPGMSEQIFITAVKSGPPPG